MWNRSPGRSRPPRDSTSGRALRRLGLPNPALTDGYIGTWETKYHYRFWRPATAIRDSGHAVEGGARGAGPDALLPHQHDELRPAASRCPRDRGGDASPTLRHFTSFSQAADENAVSASTSASTSGSRSRRVGISRPRREDRQPSGQPLPAARELRAHHASSEAPPSGASLVLHTCQIVLNCSNGCRQLRQYAASGTASGRRGSSSFVSVEPQ